MGVKVLSTLYGNLFRPEKTDYPLGVVGEPITIEHEIEIETSVVASSDEPIIFRNIDGYIGVGWLTDVSGRFKDFRVGDTIGWNRYTDGSADGSGTVLEKLDDTAIRISGTGGADNQELADFVFFVTTPITSVRYLFNLIENDEATNFLSKVDGNQQEALIKFKEADDTDSDLMEFQGEKSYQIGSVSIEGIAIDTTDAYRSRYKITHETVITPFMLSDQWQDIVNGIKPDYLIDGKSLKDVFEFEARYNYTDPNRIQQEEVTEVLGNVGWFNENFNNKPTNYFVDSVVFKNAATEVIEAIELTTNDTDLEIVIKNTIDTPFSDNNTKFLIGFNKAPADQSEYQNNGRTQDHNFLFDYALQTVGSAAINGINFGTGRQVLKTISATFISSSEIKIIAKVDLSSTIVAELSTLNDKRYMLWVIVQNHTLETKLADKVNLLVDPNDFFINVSDPDMIVFTSQKFLEHPENDPATEGQEEITAFPHDEVVHYTQFYLERQHRLSDTIVFNSLTLKIKAKNTVTSEEFILDLFTIPLTGFQTINLAQFINQTISRVFKIPDTETRKSIKISRRNDLDDGNKKYYDVYFPLLLRWGYWLPLIGANDDFFDTAEPKNGWNQFWVRYKSGNWKLFFDFKLNVNKNGNVLPFQFEQELDVTDYDTNTDWTNESIKFFKPNTATQLYDAGTLRHFFYGFELTRVEARFEKVETIESLTGYSMVLDIEPFEGGEQLDRRRISSLYETGNNDATWWKSVDNSNKVKLTLEGGNTIMGEAYLNHELIPPFQKFMVTARLYDNSEEPGKQFQDGVNFLFQDGVQYKFQDQ